MRKQQIFSSVKKENHICRDLCQLLVNWNILPRLAVVQLRKVLLEAIFLDVNKLLPQRSLFENKRYIWFTFKSYRRSLPFSKIFL